MNSAAPSAGQALDLLTCLASALGKLDRSPPGHHYGVTKVPERWPMASLTLKNVPEDLLRALREAAEVDRRSLNQEIMHLLTLALRGRVERPLPLPLDVESQLAAWRRLAGKWESDVDRATEAQQLAERRSAGREVEF